jgi:hypothetical protein
MEQMRHLSPVEQMCRHSPVAAWEPLAAWASPCHRWPPETGSCSRRGKIEENDAGAAGDENHMDNVRGLGAWSLCDGGILLHFLFEMI